MMLRDVMKFIATLAVWIICGVIAMMPVVEEGISSGAVLVISIAMIAAASTTAILWGEGKSSSAAGTETAKRKRDDANPQVDLLLAMMDDDERAAFKAELRERVLADSRARLSDDGEVSSLGALLDDEAYQRASRGG